MKRKIAATRLKALAAEGVILALAITSLSATQAFINPLPSNMKATDNGGTKYAIDAYKDGVGVMVVDNLMTTNNSAMNTLVYKYGEAAKASGSTIVDQVAYGTTNPPAADLKLVGALTVNGASCNDSNINTTGETWLNGNCQGGMYINGTTCNDGNAQTINDIYTNNICAGTNVEGQSCTDNNFLTIQDKYIDGICVGTLTANGQTCNDSNIMTINDIYTDGVCTGTLTVNGQSCDDSHIMTVNDIYTNGICAGTLTVNGTACNDGNAATTGETWLNGVCQGGVTGLQFDNCEGGSRTWANAGTYCASKGMRLPTLAEIVPQGGTTVSCPSTWTWTSTPDGSNDVYYVWTGSSVNLYNAIYLNSHLVRCVK